MLQSPARLRVACHGATALVVSAIVLIASCFHGVQAQDQSVDGPAKQIESLRQQGKFAEATLIAAQEVGRLEASLGPDHPDVGRALVRLSALYSEQAQVDKADGAARRALVILESAHGPDHPDVARAISALATALTAGGDFAAVEALDSRALAIFEKTYGSDHPDVAAALNKQGGTYFRQAKYDKAELVWVRALAIRERALGPDSNEAGQSQFNVGIVKWRRGDLKESEASLGRAVAISARNVGPDHPSTLRYNAVLAALYREMGREPEAESLLRRSLELQEKALGPNHPLLAEGWISLGVLYYQQKRYELAEPAFKQAIVIYENANRPNQAYAASALLNLASIYLEQGRLTECEPLMERGLAIKKAQLGNDHPEIAVALYNQALLRQQQGRGAESLTLLRQAMDIHEARGELRDPEAMRTRNDLGDALAASGRLEDGERSIRQALVLREEVFGTNHPSVADSLVSLGDVEMLRGNAEGARTFFERSLFIRREAWATVNHPDVATSMDRLATASQRLGRSGDALDYARGSSAILERRLKVLAQAGGSGAQSERQQFSASFARHVSLLESSHAVGERTIDESFRLAQLARASDTATQVARMASRYAAGTDTLALRVRERQDVERTLNRSESELLAEMSKPGALAQSPSSQALREKIAQTQARLAEMDAGLLREFPKYRELVDPRPIGIDEVQSLLGADEALVSFLAADEAVFAWMVTRRKARLTRLNTDRASLSEAVRTLRQHLDASADASELLRKPFPVDTAYALYVALLQPMEADFGGIRHLVLIADGPLQSLPFGILLTAPPSPQTGGDLSREPWLVKRVAVSTLPAEASLRALRAFSKLRPGDEPFGGFGDPLLDGPPGTRGVSTVALRSRGELASVEDVRRLSRLPETAAELQTIAASLKARPSALYLRDRATESQVKHTELDRFRTLAFATHGLVAGELRGLAEPALVMTPPRVASTDDDGLLTASEIAQLKLNSEWVILSACNTAADDGTPGAEGLSGLAKAFIYAGARSLLVSHWAVSSDATVLLTTQMFTEYAKGVSKAEALRRAMLHVMNRKGRTSYAHPLFWAPFVIVGEGKASLPVSQRR